MNAGQFYGWHRGCTMLNNIVLNCVFTMVVRCKTTLNVPACWPLLCRVGEKDGGWLEQYTSLGWQHCQAIRTLKSSSARQGSRDVLPDVLASFKSAETNLSNDEVRNELSSGEVRNLLCSGEVRNGLCNGDVRNELWNGEVRNELWLLCNGEVINELWLLCDGGVRNELCMAAM